MSYVISTLTVLRTYGFQKTLFQFFIKITKSFFLNLEFCLTIAIIISYAHDALAHVLESVQFFKVF